VGNHDGKSANCPCVCEELRGSSGPAGDRICPSRMGVGENDRLLPARSLERDQAFSANSLLLILCAKIRRLAPSRTVQEVSYTRLLLITSSEFPRPALKKFALPVNSIVLQIAPRWIDRVRPRFSVTFSEFRRTKARNDLIPPGYNGYERHSVLCSIGIGRFPKPSDHGGCPPAPQSFVRTHT